MRPKIRRKVKDRTLRIEGCGTRSRNQLHPRAQHQLLRLHVPPKRTSSDAEGQEKSKTAPLKPKGAAPKVETKFTPGHNISCRGFTSRQKELARMTKDRKSQRPHP